MRRLSLPLSKCLESTGRTAGPNTVRTYLTVLTAACSTAVASEWLAAEQFEPCRASQVQAHRI